jgi:hypothetical protein
MENIGFWKRIKTKIETLPPSGKFILKGARYGGFAGYTLSVLYALPFATLLFLCLTLISVTNTHNDWYITVAPIVISFLGIWLGFFILFIVPASLTGTISGSITALILYFFYERIDLTPFRAIILTIAFWSPLVLVQSIVAIRELAEIVSEPFFQWSLLYIPNMIFLFGMGYVAYKLFKYSATLEQSAGENCQ